MIGLWRSEGTWRHAENVGPRARRRHGALLGRSQRAAAVAVGVDEDSFVSPAAHYVAAATEGCYVGRRPSDLRKFNPSRDVNRRRVTHRVHIETAGSRPGSGSDGSLHATREPESSRGYRCKPVSAEMSDDDDYSTEVESELRIAERKRRRQQRAGSPQKTPTKRPGGAA